MRYFVVSLILVCLLATPAFAYRVDAVAIEKAPGVSANTVKVSSTATPLGSSTAINRVTIFNRATYEVFVGGSTVTKGGGYLLNPGASTTGNTVTIETNNLANVYIIGTNENNGSVSYLIETK